MIKFLKEKTSTKFKIIYTKILFVILLLMYFAFENIVSFWFHFSYLLFLVFWFALSLFFKNERSVVYDEKLKMIMKKFDALSLVLIVSLIIFRFFIVENILTDFWVVNIALATYAISIWFFVWKFYFAFKKAFKFKKKYSL